MGIVYTNKNQSSGEKTIEWQEELEMESLNLSQEEKKILDEGITEPSGSTIQGILNYSKTTEFSSTSSGDFKGNKN